MQSPSFLHSVCPVLSVLPTVGGGLDVMPRGLEFLNESHVEMRAADATAWLATAVFFAAGLISLAIGVSRRD